MSTRDYNFKKTVSICPDCSKKIFYRHKHDCIKYEPVGMEEQVIADELDDENNRNKTGIYLCNGWRYNLINVDEPIKKYIPPVDFVYEPKPEPPPKKSYEKFLCPCGVFINDHTKDNHERTNKHKKTIKRLNKC